MSATKTKPITFTTALIPAILNGTKTQTRRLVKPRIGNKDLHLFDLDRAWVDGDLKIGGEYLHVPFCLKEVGWEDNPADDTVWRVRPRYQPGDLVRIKGTNITLRITDVRLQRVQDIDNIDADAEGTPDLRTIENGWVWAYTFERVEVKP